MTEPARVACVACLEPIRQGARRCPHCGSPQRPEKIRLAASMLKWVGGVTAVISLVVGSASVHELYTAWRDKAVAVDELNAAAQIQLDSEDYEGGWSLLQQALDLEPASRATRRFQVPFAMRWLRNIRVPEGETFSSIVDRLLPVLYRGAADARPAVAADVYAHIGWANYLKQRDGNLAVRVDDHYRKALALDPGNPYAHAHWGHWILIGQRDPAAAPARPVATAMEHFDAALAAGRDHGYVADLALITLTAAREPEAERAALDLAERFRQEDRLPSADNLARLAAIFQPIANRIPQRAEDTLERLLGDRTAADLLVLYAWIVERAPATVGGTAMERLFIQARLTEAAGNQPAAHALSRALADGHSVDPQFRDNLLDPALARTDGQLMPAVGR